MQVTSTLLKTTRKSIIILAIPLVLSAFTHLWNPIGFPSVYIDEEHYMRRTMHVLNGLGPQESTDAYTMQYDHPYFGQIFLASMLRIIGYPASLNPSTATDHLIDSIETLHLVPRVLMGILAVVDTFLIYKIAEVRYNRKVAFIASILFAVMPISWVTRRIYLENLQLPLLLLSILFAVYYAKRNYSVLLPLSTKSSGEQIRMRNNNNNILLVMLSGIFLGLAIFTKIPVFTMIPLIAYLIIRSYAKTTIANNDKDNNRYNNSTSARIAKRLGRITSLPRLKALGIWFIPVILIPLIWPAYNLLTGQFDAWFHGVLGWEGRLNSKGISGSLNSISSIDPVLLSLGVAGIVFAGAIKRDFIFLLWIIPFVIYFAAIGYIKFYYWIPLLPAFCISAAVLITYVSDKISNRKNKSYSKKNIVIVSQKILPYAIISAIAIFGLVSTIMLITNSVNSSYFQIYASFVQYLPDYNKNGNGGTNNDRVTVIGKDWVGGLSWIPKYVYGKDHDFIKPSYKTLTTKKVIMIVDKGLKKDIFGNDKDIFTPAYAADNNLKTRWASKGIGSWIQADLGGTKFICSINITWYKGNERSYNFVISSSSSSDGTNFKNIYTGNSSRLAIPQTYDFSDIAARYIRITVNGNTDNNAAVINDIKLFGYDQDKPISTSNSCKKLPMTMTGIVGSVGDKQKELLQMLYYNSTKLAKLGRTEIRANIES